MRLHRACQTHIINHKRDSLDIDTTRQNIGGDENLGEAATE